MLRLEVRLAQGEPPPMEVWMMVGVWAQDIPEKKMILQKGAPADSPAKEPSKNIPPHHLWCLSRVVEPPIHLKNMIVKLDSISPRIGVNI